MQDFIEKGQSFDEFLKSSYLTATEEGYLVLHNAVEFFLQLQHQLLRGHQFLSHLRDLVLQLCVLLQTKGRRFS